MAKAKTTKRALTSVEKFDKQFAKLTDAGLILLQDARRGSFKASDIKEYSDFMDCVRQAIDVFMNNTDAGSITIELCDCEDDCCDCENEDEDCGCFCENCEREECMHADDDFSDADGDEDFCEENVDMESAVGDLEKYWHDTSDVNKPPFDAVAMANSSESAVNNTPNDVMFSSELNCVTGSNFNFGKPVSTFMFAGYTWNVFAGVKPGYCGNIENKKYPIFTILSDPQTGREICTSCVCMRNNGIFHTEMPYDVIRAFNAYASMNHAEDDPRAVKLVGDKMYTMTFGDEFVGHPKLDLDRVYVRCRDIMGTGMLTVYAAYMQALNLSLDDIITNESYWCMVIGAMKLFKRNFLAKDIT